MRTDAEIQLAVQRELSWETRVTATHVGVTVDDGAVTLTGTVGSFAERLAAQEAAHRVAGVLDVANDLVVYPSGVLARSDTSIAQAVRHALEWDVMVPDQQIRSTVANGWVTLDGTVNVGHQRDDAELAVRSLAGVRGVSNRIQVRISDAAEAKAIQHEIEAALERRATRTAHRVNVAVNNGTATISGEVHSLAEKRAIIGAVRGTAGVSAIRDEVVVDLTAH